MSIRLNHGEEDLSAGCFGNFTSDSKIVEVHRWSTVSPHEVSEDTNSLTFTIFDQSRYWIHKRARLTPSVALNDVLIKATIRSDEIRCRLVILVLQYLQLKLAFRICAK